MYHAIADAHCLSSIIVTRHRRCDRLPVLALPFVPDAVAFAVADIVIILPCSLRLNSSVIDIR